ncbi:hypothetical protein ASPZODRAFT_311522 [Penicilliopsis zonata CBS 506.65]|uniref:Kinesin motor domain-containing protein n=1 Tax=Penicilliopsis zonata CBS 506.65 TaxID=1073090 RepID=A0A1L9SV01_9EURO|nr:hypothetical protein ASPZODRAFT_311522 [Penicilliopsis zonata CBS 506.65]OJJ51052.1 hypothetical protein ASPZODRAFT_311522 [Penicilliopsis zonata CBS 506.65]
MVHVTSPTNLAVDVPQGRKLFVFDRVFPETVDQEGIWEYLSDSVNSFVQGYNVSILAYGQSGAGKSYTMGTASPNEQSDTKGMGIIPRAAQLLFEKLDGTVKSNRNSVSGLRTPTRYSMNSTTSIGKNALEKNWQLKATYVEIYNEHLRDLLLPESTPQGDRTTVTIREDTKGRILLTGLHQVNINSFEDLMNALHFGSSIRQTDSTAINAKSSRSHAVFSLNLIQRKSAFPSVTSPKDKRMSMPVESLSGSDASVTVDSKLHFVDLAGSERLKNTQASGERAKEGISINAGLAALGKVISQLSSRQAGSHVSYRDSKLTRLLQDSLGGNAITYMIACVTPAEFHLSETVNTVQYAQRARAIQSKPRIQQVADDGDKHAVIERLKAEVAFLRQQIRNAEGNDRRSIVPQDRSERQNEREMELQNQLLDTQESYNALSQRHARLIAELTNQTEGTNGEADEGTTSSVERLKRSSSFAQSVEQVVLEYEKTIQSLESSLSNTRSSLAVTESTLLERETKCAYIETVNSQLQTRIQKMVDREVNTETYLRDLESKLDGHSSGEEKQSAIVNELRKELTRARESEASCEDYISTLEERLAEADQDMELMQREMERLEHVIDRQRSLGKLDNLLYELDHLSQQNNQNGIVPEEDASFEEITPHQPVVTPMKSAQHGRKRTMSSALDVLTEAVETAIPESDDDLVEPIPEVDDDRTMESELTPAAEKPSGDGDDDDNDVDDSDDLQTLEKVSNHLDLSHGHHFHEYEPPSPAQSKFVADKLETVTQELFDLRMQHEATMTDYELLEAKYEEALKALAEMQQDAADEVRHPAAAVHALLSQTAASRPVSFLGEGKTPESARTGDRRAFSQSLSSELSLVGESGVASPEASPRTLETEQEPEQEHSQQEEQEEEQQQQEQEQEQPQQTEKPENGEEFHSAPASALMSAAESVVGSDETAAAQEMENMRRLLGEHQEGVSIMTQKYAQLQAEHEETLGLVETLRGELQRTRSASSPPTTPGFKTPVIRRVTSQNLMSTVDRAHRSLAALRNIAIEEFDGRPDTMQNFEVHLDSAMHELHTRMERIQALEAENQSVKKEMEMKTTIISGLTRERSSLQGASPVDRGLVSQLRDQAVQQEQQIHALMEAHDLREKELLAEIEALSDLVKTQAEAQVEAAGGTEAQAHRIGALEEELAEWKGKHAAVVEALQTSESKLTTSLAELEAALVSIEALHAERDVAERATGERDAATQEASESERAVQQELVESLNGEIAGHKATIATQLDTIAGLQQSHDEAQERLSEALSDREGTASAIETQRLRIFELEQEMENHHATVDAHQKELQALEESHKRQLEELAASTKAALQADAESRLAERDAVHDAEHVKVAESLKAEILESRQELAKMLQTVSKILRSEVTPESLSDQIEDVVSQKQHFSEKYVEMMEANEELNRKLQQTSSLDSRVEELNLQNSVHEAKVNELALLVATLEDTMRQKDEQIKKKDSIIEEIAAEKQKSIRLVEDVCPSSSRSATKPSRTPKPRSPSTKRRSKRTRCAWNSWSSSSRTAAPRSTHTTAAAL